MNTMNARVVCAIGFALGLLAVSPASVRAQAPQALPLLQAGNMRYLGSFPVVRSDGSGSDEGSLTYGGSALSVNPATQTLLMAGHDWYQRLCEVRIPTAGGQTAQVVQRCADVTEGRRRQIDSGDVKLGGSLVWNGRLIVSAYSYYDADGSARASHFVSGLNFGQTGDVQGPFQVGTTGAGFVAGYMGVIPNEWRALLGGPALTGQCCLSIISRTSSGPSVSVFNPDDVGRVNPIPATPLLGYPLSLPLALNSTQNALFNNATEIVGVAFPAGTRSVLFIGRQGLGPYCYGEASACGDPVQIYKGSHAYPYVHQVWAYDANDLLAVKQGLRQAWSIRPYATWHLSEITAAGNAASSGAAYDHATGRLYITENYGEKPRVHAYQIGSASTLAAPVPGAPQNLTGVVSGSTVSLSWSPPAGGGVAGYLVEAGSAAGSANLVQTPVGATTTTVTAPAAPGRYYVRVRAFNHTPAAGPPSNEVAVTVAAAALPGPPVGLRATVGANRTVMLSWSAPQTGGAATTYVLEAGSAQGLAQLASDIGSVTSLGIPRVPAGTYYIRARARNAAGIGPATADIRVIVP